MSEFSEKEKLMVKLAYIAYEGCDKRSEQEIHDSISEKLNNSKLNQKLVWGPAIHGPDSFINWEVLPFRVLKNFLLRLSSYFAPLFEIGSKYGFVNALAYIMQDNNCQDEYTVVIRGTNMVCLREWIFQDFMIKKMKPWASVSKYTEAETRAQISEATYNSIKIHQKLKPSIGEKDKELLVFLKEIIQKSENKITFNFTGHSLGGLMASTLAVLLYDELSQVEREKVNLYVYSFACPTAGNKQFAEYCDRILGTNCTRYVNKLDAATYIWNKDEMKSKLPGLYEPTVPMDDLIRGALAILIENIKDKDYTQLSNKKEVYSAVCSKGLMRMNHSYIAQVIYQHIYPYTSTIAGDSRELTILKDVAIQLVKCSDLHEEVKTEVIAIIEENHSSIYPSRA